jgi:hypothetical protein
MILSRFGFYFLKKEELKGSFFFSKEIMVLGHRSLSDLHVLRDSAGENGDHLI